MKNLNVAHFFDEGTRLHGDRVAVVVPEIDENLTLKRELSYTFTDLRKIAAEFRSGLEKQGYKKGDRIIILLPITVEIYALMMAMWSLGLVTVFLDPGIGLKKIIVALQDSKAKAIISIDKLLKYRWWLPPLWFKKKYCSDSQGLFLRPFASLRDPSATEFECVELQPQDHALITYTGGSTGRAKGANRDALNFYHQFSVIRDSWVFGADQVDFPSFPMFGLINLCLGVKTVVPAVDFAQVGEQSSETIVNQIQTHKVTRMSGAPRFIGKLTDYAHELGIVLDTVRHIVLGGAAITKADCQKMLAVFPNADIKMVYGSTEAPPIAFINIEELVEAEGQGGLVGRPIPELQVKIVDLPDILPEFDARGYAPYEVPAGAPGEIIIKGPHVVQGYIDNPGADASTKIIDTDGIKWHRTGDVGYFDDKGRLWLTGRKSDLITLENRVIYPYVIEQRLDALPNVKRAAIIQSESGTDLHLVIEPQRKPFDPGSLSPNLEELQLQGAKLHIIDKIPVDDRHNSKIDRIELRKLVCS